MNLRPVPMTYPSRLLPKSYFKKILWKGSLKNYYLIHYTETKDLIDPNTQKLKISFVVKQTDHLRDYSNNLLGVFLVDDVYWGSTNESSKKAYYQDEWEVGNEVETPKIPDEFIRYEDRGYFFLNIDNCHEEIVHFDDITSASPVCKLLHTPTNANFWHFSLRWFFNGKDLEKWSGGIKRRMKTSAKAFIVERAFFGEPVFEELDQSMYTK